MKSTAEKVYVREREAFRDLSITCMPPNRRHIACKVAYDEFDQVIASGRFTQLAVQDGSLLGRTRLIWVPRGDSVYYLGEYVIEVTKEYFAAYNLTLTLEEYHHPHINQAGQFCMPQGKDEIMCMIKEGWPGRALIAIESVLWQVGPGVQFAAAQLEKWPTARGETK